MINSFGTNDVPLYGVAVNYDGDIPGFLSFLQLGAASDTYDQRSERIAFMSLHAAKGLEFPCIFVVGIEQEIVPFPFLRNMMPPSKVKRKSMKKDKRMMPRIYSKTHFLAKAMIMAFFLDKNPSLSYRFGAEGHLPPEGDS